MASASVIKKFQKQKKEDAKIWIWIGAVCNCGKWWRKLLCVRLGKTLFLSFASLTFPLAAKTGSRIFNVSSSSSSLIDCHFLNNDRQFYQKYLKTFVFQFENSLKIHV